MVNANPLTAELLQQLAARWRALDAPIARRLAPGLADFQIDALTEPVGLSVPPEARIWWRWHNGGDDQSIVHNGGKAFISLERSVERAARMRQIARDITAPYRLGDEEPVAMARDAWNPNWLPLCPDGVGGMAVISARVHQDAQPTCPVFFRDWDGAASLLKPSIGSLVRQWIDALDAGAATYDRTRETWTLVPERLPPGFDERLL